MDGQASEINISMDRTFAVVKQLHKKTSIFSDWDLNDFSLFPKRKSWKMRSNLIATRMCDDVDSLCKYVGCFSRIETCLVSHLDNEHCELISHHSFLPLSSFSLVNFFSASVLFWRGKI